MTTLYAFSSIPHMCELCGTIVCVRVSWLLLIDGNFDGKTILLTSPSTFNYTTLHTYSNIHVHNGHSSADGHYQGRSPITKLMFASPLVASETMPHSFDLICAVPSRPTCCSSSPDITRPPVVGFASGSAWYARRLVLICAHFSASFSSSSSRSARNEQRVFV